MHHTYVLQLYIIQLTITCKFLAQSMMQNIKTIVSIHSIDPDTQSS